MAPIYLDHNASTPVYPEVLDAMLPYLKDSYGNASSIHSFGQRNRKAIEDARIELAQFLNAEDPNEIVFTSGGTESNNMAIKGALEVHRHKGKRIVSSAFEHSAVRHVLQHLAAENEADTVVVPVTSDGFVRLPDIEEATTPDTAIVSIMTANNEIGTIQPIAEIAKLCQKKGVTFHTDAVQGAGKMPIDVRGLSVDMLSLSAHKFGGPKGIGLLYIKKGTRLSSLIEGGSQEKNRRGGTENVAGIVGMAKAAQIVRSHLTSEMDRLKNLRDQLEKGVLSSISNTSVNGNLANRTVNTSNILFDFTDSSQMVMALDLKGVACSNGSACAAGNPKPSHVLLAIGLPQDKAHASLRFSVGSTTTDSDIKQAIEIIKETTARVRESHPLWKKSA